MSVQLIQAVTALVAVIVGPIVTLIGIARQSRVNVEVSRRAYAASVIATSRQRWIDTLRETIAEFQTALVTLRYISQSKKDLCEWYDDANFEKAHLMRSRLALLINPLEADHAQLLILMDTALSIAATPMAKETLIKEAEVNKQITEKAQIILKREWERVKSGESVSNGASLIRRSDS